MFYDFLKLMFVCKETSKKRLYTKKNLKKIFFFFFCTNNHKRNAPFTFCKFYIAYIEQVLNENFTNSNLGKFYIIECCLKIKFLFYP